MNPRAQTTHRAHHVPAKVGHFSLAGEISELRATPQYETTGQAARTLIKRAEITVVLVVLARGAALQEHRLMQPVSIQTVVGTIGVDAPEICEELRAGDLQVLDSAVAHGIQAVEDSAILLTIT